MKETLIALVGMGLLAGGGSPTTLGGPVTTSALREGSAPLVISAEAPKDFGPVIEDGPDLSVAKATRGGFEPLAELDASARARTKWENSGPEDEGTSRPATRHSAAGRTSTLAAVSAARSDRGNYDRNAAMRNLINGGKIADKRICDGC